MEAGGRYASERPPGAIPASQEGNTIMLTTWGL